MPRPLEQVVSGLLRPPARPYRGAEVERLALAKDAFTVTDSTSSALMSPEGRVGFALTGYSQVGGTGSTYNPDTSSGVVTADSGVVTADAWV